MRNANKNLKVTTSEKDRKIKCLNDRLQKNVVREDYTILIFLQATI